MAVAPQRSAIANQTEPPSMGEMSKSYEAPKRWLSSSRDVDTSDDDDDVGGFYDVVSPYLKNMWFLDEPYSIGLYGNKLIISNSDVIADEKHDISIGEKRFRGTKGLWELSSRKNVNSDVTTNSDIKRYKHILELTNAHLVGFELGGDIQISRGSKYTKVISKLLPQTRRRSALRQRWSPYYDGR